MRLRDLQGELPPLLALAWPLILGELGWTAMSIVDTVMVGRLPHSAVPMAAASLAQVLFNTLVIAVAGLIIGLDTPMSQSFGAGDRDAFNRWMWHALALSVVLAAAVSGIFLAATPLLTHLHADPRILVLAVPALRGLLWGVPPLMVYFALRRYLQSAHHTGAIAFAVVSANLINAALDWLLIYPHGGHAGHGAPAGSLVAWLPLRGYGVVGSSWATSLSRTYIAAVLLAAVLWYNRRHDYGLLRASRRLTRTHFAAIWRLGAPIGGSIFVEIGIFALVTSLCATLGALPLAGHEVALQCASTTFMVPLALSSATAVRVGFRRGQQRIGESSASAIAAAGWSGVLLGGGFMLLSSAVLLTAPQHIARVFTTDAAVVAAAVPLMMIAAGFQFFDGLQVTLAGALRGLGDTVSPLVTQLVCYWLLAAPLGVWLCFRRGLGARGLWWGLLVGLLLAATVMLEVWRRTVRRLLAARAPAIASKAA